MVIFYFILGLKSQIIEFTIFFTNADIPRGEQVFIEYTRYFNICGGQNDVVLIPKKIIYGQAKFSWLWYEFFRNIYIYHGFVVGKVGPYPFIYNTVICVVYVDYCLFYEFSKSNIDKNLRSFKE